MTNTFAPISLYIEPGTELHQDLCKGPNDDTITIFDIVSIQADPETFTSAVAEHAMSLLPIAVIHEPDSPNHVEALKRILTDWFVAHRYLPLAK